MLLIMTAVAAFFAYHVNWIRERPALCSRPDVEVWIVMDGDYPRAPGLLPLFGEIGRDQVYIVVDLPLDPSENVPVDRERSPQDQADFDPPKYCSQKLR